MNLLGHNSPSPWSSRTKLRRLLWLLVAKTVFRWSPPSCFRWRNFCLRAFGATVRDRREAPARVWPDADIHFPWQLTLGAGTLIGPGCRIYNLAPVALEDGANLSRHIHLCAGSHDFTRWEMPLTTAPITISRNAWIATDCFVGPGVSIGELAVVGARSVVVKDLPAATICVGNPARPIKPRPPIV